MITAIEGTLAGTGLDWADIAVGGVTLRVYTPQNTVDNLGQPGAEVRLFTSLQVKEDSLTLYGFATKEARLAFEALIGVNGVGPRVALSVLSTLSPDSLSLAVATGDADGFKGIPGVGTKIANRIVLELSGKLDFDRAATPGVRDTADVVEALTALGYAASEAMAAVSKIPPEDSLSLEDKVRLALQRIGSR